jgi:hypothetical protein
MRGRFFCAKERRRLSPAGHLAKGDQEAVGAVIATACV